MPEVESYKYVKSRNAIDIKKLPEAARKALYDSVVYQICLRTIHELFEADVVNAVDSVVFNGVVTATNPATGVTESKGGRDSYEFAKGKPLTLLNGSNLLSMLEKHGKQARIDTFEAKKILGLATP